jgi:hypothetical protein
MKTFDELSEREIPAFGNSPSVELAIITWIRHHYIEYSDDFGRLADSARRNAGIHHRRAHR